MDSGSSFDASSEVFAGGDLPFAVGSGNVSGGNNVFGGGGEREVKTTERARRWDSFLDTVDSSIEQQYRTAFCGLEHTRSS